jgi:anti-sigma factor RsiW
MNEKIPQHIILDLLPLYLADEVSDETRRAIEEYLERDPQLAKLAEQAKMAPTLQEIPAPLNKETEMKAYKKGRKLMVQHNVFLFMAVLTTFLSVPAAISLYDEFRPAPFLFLGIAAIFWSGFFWVNRKIED